MTILSDRTIKSLCTGDCRDHRLGAKTQRVVFEEQMKSLGMSEQQTQEIRGLCKQLGGDSVVDTVSHTNVIPDETYEINNNHHPMITPFVDHQVRVNGQDEKIISYGLSSYGYDVRLSPKEIKLFTNVNGGIVDPMKMDSDTCLTDAVMYGEEEGHPYFILPPNSYALGCTVENFNIPRNVSVVCVGKSTLARAGAAVNVTPVEAGFEGTVVIEIANQSTLPIKIYLGTGIAQFQFFHGDQPCETSYADGSRKYQGQQGVTLSRV